MATLLAVRTYTPTGKAATNRSSAPSLRLTNEEYALEVATEAGASTLRGVDGRRDRGEKLEHSKASLVRFLQQCLGSFPNWRSFRQSPPHPIGTGRCWFHNSSSNIEVSDSDGLSEHESPASQETGRTFAEISPILSDFTRHVVRAARGHHPPGALTGLSRSGEQWRTEG